MSTDELYELEQAIRDGLRSVASAIETLAIAVTEVAVALNRRSG